MIIVYFSVGIPLGQSYFGSGAGPIHFDDLLCTGDQQSIIGCGHDNRGTHSCDHSQDAGVRCDLTGNNHHVFSNS